MKKIPFAHLFCCLVIAVLATLHVWDWRLERQRAAVFSDFSSTIQKGAPAAHEIIFGLLEDIETEADSYKTPRNEDFRHRSELIANSADSMLLLLKKRPIEPLKIETDYAIFREKVDATTDYDLMIKDQLDLIFWQKPKEIGRFLMKCNSAQAEIFTDLLSQRVEEEAVTCMKYFSRNFGGSSDFESFVPEFCPSTIYPKVGEMFEADLVLTGFSPCRGNKIWVNDEPVPIHAYVGKFEKTWPEAGKFPLHVRAEMVHWNDHKLDTTLVEKTFQINVSPAGEQ